MGSIGQLECPACHAQGVSTELTTIDIPYFGEVAISTFQCPSCGMKGNDVHPMKGRGPSRYTLNVSSPSDLNARVVRSSTSYLSVPEIGLVIEPGPSLDGYVTNVEGVLRRLLAIVRMMEGDLGEDPDRMARARDLLALLERFADGMMAEGESLTLILEDPKGNGLIASQDGGVLFEPITEAGVQDHPTVKGALAPGGQD